MTWTKEDTEALRTPERCLYCGKAALPWRRAAAHIEALESEVARLRGLFDAARIEELEARVRELNEDNESLRSCIAMRTEIVTMTDTGGTIPRAVLVKALREQVDACRLSQASPCVQAWLDFREAMFAFADEIESGEWPGEG